MYIYAKTISCIVAYGSKKTRFNTLSHAKLRQRLKKKKKKAIKNQTLTLLNSTLTPLLLLER